MFVKLPYRIDYRMIVSVQKVFFEFRMSGNMNLRYPFAGTLLRYSKGSKS